MIKIILDLNITVEVKYFVFNDGSVQVELGDIPAVASHAIIQAQLTSPTEQMALFMATNALRQSYPMIETHLIMPFTPYGRQDAAFLPGQVNAMKAWAGFINNLGFETVSVIDPHSIAVEFINNIVVLDQIQVLQQASSVNPGLWNILNGDVTLVSPDAGSNKKSHKICQLFGIQKLVRADKARDLRTGDIIETEVFGSVEGETCVIVDDICDGGMTFIKLAEKLKELGATKVVLFVTHGLFTKGLSVFEGKIDEIYTTDSWPQEEVNTDGFTGTYIICTPDETAC